MCGFQGLSRATRNFTDDRLHASGCQFVNGHFPLAKAIYAWVCIAICYDLASLGGTEARALHRPELSRDNCLNSFTASVSTLYQRGLARSRASFDLSSVAGGVLMKKFGVATCGPNEFSSCLRTGKHPDPRHTKVICGAPLPHRTHAGTLLNPPSLSPYRVTSAFGNPYKHTARRDIAVIRDPSRIRWSADRMRREQPLFEAGNR